ncbi:MAG: Trypsin-like serine protease with C-terminal domain, partial [Frankiales bacterium]|nr:Trypsin-like serine protease with C-terminal domain [Frankiales bacterium]
MKPDVLDLILLFVAFVYAVGGFRNGAVVGGLSFAGFFGGAAVGAQLARPLGRSISHGSAQVPVAIVCVLLFATVGQLVAVTIASRIRSKVKSQPVRYLDSAVGSVFSVLAVLL